MNLFEFEMANTQSATIDLDEVGVFVNNGKGTTVVHFKGSDQPVMVKMKYEDFFALMGNIYGIGNAADAVDSLKHTEAAMDGNLKGAESV